MGKKLLFTLPLVVSQVVMAQTAQNLPMPLPALDKHVHGVATLDIAIEGNELSIDLDSPAFNLFGFEHEAKTPEEQAAVKKVRTILDNPSALFGIPAAAKCTIADSEIEIPLAGHDHPHEEGEDHDHDHEHSDVEAGYTFNCSDLANVKSLDLASFFTNFPSTEKINVQLVAPSGQAMFEASSANSKISW